MKKLLTLEMTPGPDGSLSDEAIAELRTRMGKIIDDESSIPESRREEARRRADALAEELRAVKLSTRSIVMALGECLQTLERLPLAVRGIAQRLDSPSHIFDLGAAATELVLVEALIGSAKDTLQRTLDCDHCQPEPKKEGLS